MSLSPLASVREISKAIQELGIDYVFVGGSVVELLLDHPDLVSIRPTDDVDVVLRILTRPPYAQVEEELRNLGFSHDMRENAPQCRWLYQGITVDVMPAGGAFMGLNTVWFGEALNSLDRITLDGIEVPVISPVVFLATKFAAFKDRGDNDYYGSHDLEDIITLIDGRGDIVEKIKAAPADLRKCVSENINIHWCQQYVSLCA